MWEGVELFSRDDWRREIPLPVKVIISSSGHGRKKEKSRFATTQMANQSGYAREGFREKVFPPPRQKRNSPPGR